jgi:hypothetical protein
MPLQNRMTPIGEPIAISARGTLMGNRGGRFHDHNREIGARRWVSKQWICCKLDFNNRHREVWGDGYTELFFLDEVTAFAAGHRPCFECRRKDANTFAKLFSGKKKRSSAPAMDEVLHAERLDGKVKRLHRRKIDMLPDGAMVVLDGHPFAVRGKKLLPWTPRSYGPPVARRRGKTVDVLTPPSILAVLSAGYTPLWHESASFRGQV